MVSSKWHNGATFGIWRMNETNDVLRSMLVEPFGYDEELSELKAQSRKTEYLSVRALLKEICGRELRVSHLPSGKPFLPDCKMNISISHTKGFAAVGIHQSAIVGIDIERISERVRRASSRFIRNDEIPGFNSMGNEEQLYQLLLHWSAKETMFKMLDKAGVDFQEHLRISPFSLKCEGEMIGEEFLSPELMKFRIGYTATSEYVCTYSCKEM